jgi:hypothetical protein
MDGPLLAPTFQVENEDFDLFLKSNLTMMWKYANDKGNLLRVLTTKPLEDTNLKRLHPLFT